MQARTHWKRNLSTLLVTVKIRTLTVEFHDSFSKKLKRHHVMQLYHFSIYAWKVSLTYYRGSWISMFIAAQLTKS